jgi:maltooligosyltrehalose trehalohydrolase
MHDSTTHPMPFGTTLLDAGGVRFRLWAPSAASIALRLHADGGPRDIPMQTLAGGWHELVVPSAGPGSRYAFVTPSGLAVPDPASRFNPDDVHAPSMVVDPAAHAWRDTGWTGRPWHEAVIYELHVGAFTPAGTFLAAIDRLPELAALGVTAVELMPVADFPGRRGWGYDGVLPFAPDVSYGTPDDLKRLVDAAHAQGLMVLLDVVYNHFGPEGNYLHAFCPEFFNPAHQTPWGAAINFDGPGNRVVRDFFVHNALYWVEEFHIDGLRLDAVHAIRDPSSVHICCEIGHALRDGPGRHRAVHLVLENDDNTARWLERAADGRAACADAQWNDDIHHAAHVLATGEADGYYAEYADAPIAHFGRCLAEGFAWQGEPSPWRGDTARGEPSAQLAATAFVSFLQNHDQVGNRAFGERVGRLADPARIDALQACLLLAPQVPLLFMGEEFAASTPFLYFCDFEPGLAEAVSHGRREEFKRFAAFHDASERERIPDPNAQASFVASKLDWDERLRRPHAQRLAMVRELLGLRRQWLVPRLAGMRHGGRCTIDKGVLDVQWTLGDGSTWRLALNLCCMAAPFARGGQTIYAHRAEAANLLPDGVVVSLEPPRG